MKRNNNKLSYLLPLCLIGVVALFVVHLITPSVELPPSVHKELAKEKSLDEYNVIKDRLRIVPDGQDAIITVYWDGYEMGILPFFRYGRYDQYYNIARGFVVMQEWELVADTIFYRTISTE